jgi:hypothetical protein
VNIDLAGLCQDAFHLFAGAAYENNEIVSAFSFTALRRYCRRDWRADELCHSN